MQFSKNTSSGNTNVIGLVIKSILGLVFILVLQPISLIMKIFGYDPLRRSFNNDVKSYRENKHSNNTDLNRIF